MKIRSSFLFYTLLTLTLLIGLAACSDGSDQTPEPAPAPDRAAAVLRGARRRDDGAGDGRLRADGDAGMASRAGQAVQAARLSGTGSRPAWIPTIAS